MKYGVLLLSMLVISFAYSQITLQINHTYVNDGALGMQVGLTNAAADSVTIDISNTSYLFQLPFALSSLDSSLSSSGPLSFILFYHNDSLISEPVSLCNSRLPGEKQLHLKSHQTYNLHYESRCLSDGVLKRLNNGKSIKAVYYVLYRLNGKIYTARSSMTRVKVSH